VEAVALYTRYYSTWLLLAYIWSILFAVNASASLNIAVMLAGTEIIYMLARLTLVLLCVLAILTCGAIAAATAGATPATAGAAATAAGAATDWHNSYAEMCLTAAT
jgi:hypothetical protein